MNIQLEDYVSPDEIKAIVENELKLQIREQLKGESNITRILSNAAHGSVYQIVDDHIGEDSKSIIHAKIIEIIKGLTAFSVFKSPDAWDRGPNYAYTMLQSAIAKNREVIENQVRAIAASEMGKVARKDVKQLILEALLGELQKGGE